MTQETTKGFVELFESFVQQDNARALGMKVSKQAAAELSVRISVMNAETLKKEQALEQAQEACTPALLNQGKAITDGDSYTATLLETHNQVLKAQKELDNHKNALAFFESQLAIVKS